LKKTLLMTYTKLAFREFLRIIPLVVLVLAILLFPFSRTGHMVFFVLISIVGLIYGWRSFTVKNTFLLLAFTFLLWHLTTGFLQGFPAVYWADFDTKIALFVYPLMFLALRKNFLNLKADTVLRLTILGTSAASLMTIITGISGFVSTGRSYMLSQTYVVMDQMHPSYYGLILCMGLWFICFNMMFKNRSTTFEYVTLILHVVAIAMVSARSAILITGLTLVVLLGYWVYSKRWIPLLVLTVLLVAGLTYSAQVQNSFMNRFSVILSNDNSTAHKKSTVRLRVWEQSLEAISNAPITGYGPGEEQAKLNELYVKNEMDIALKQKLNAHNQYLQTGLASGLVGVLILISMLLYVSWMAFRAKNYPLFGLQLMFLLAFLFESVFELKAGVFHYAFFTSLLYLYNTQYTYGNDTIFTAEN